MAVPPDRAAARLRAAKQAVAGVVRGKDSVIELSLVAIIAGGHVLLEDIPGTGKTTLAATLTAVLGGDFRRIQFTSDLLPGDITGVNVLSPGGGFAFRSGPIFANLVLADEINRATPRTQSALLEAMSERRVTVDGVRHPLPDIFTVIATQNPQDFQGTFPLPESQLDRFLIRLSMGYPDREHERAILRRGRNPTPPEAVISVEEVAELAASVDEVTVHAEVEDYLLDLVEKTRTDGRLLRGVSTRGAEALYRAARALALARGRGFVIPEDIRTLAAPILGHRVIARAASGPPGAMGRHAVQEILWELTPPG
ncbi:MAG: MoxR family ATPase [Myxococcota bacterium]